MDLLKKTPQDTLAAYMSFVRGEERGCSDGRSELGDSDSRSESAISEGTRREMKEFLREEGYDPVSPSSGSADEEDDESDVDDGDGEDEDSAEDGGEA